MNIYTLHFDGSCGPKNPGGTAAYGFVLHRPGFELETWADHGVIGTGAGMTNNLAEFYAVSKGLEAFLQNADLTRGTVLNVYGDSALVINIMNRKWNAKPDKAYFPAYEAAIENLRTIRRSGVTVFFDWVPRKDNQQCDDLSKAHQKA